MMDWAALMAQVAVMDWADLANGVFEGSAAAFVVLSIIRLYHDKLVRGISPYAATFFTLWGFWNVFYYSHIAQPLSWYGGIAVVVTNIIWVGQIYFYIRKEAKRPPLPEGSIL